MKRAKRNTMRLFVLTAIILLPGYSKAQDNLIGTWVLDVDKSVKLMAGEMKSRYDSLSSEKRVAAQAAMSGRTFTFQEDGVVSVAWRSKEAAMESTGNWKADVSTGTVTITIDNRAQVFDYKVTGDKELRLVHQKVSGFFSTLCFTRQ